jgi:hypothetical protein
MKFPSLTRTPKHKRFNYQPRYYDPIKEDIKNRTERIRGELLKNSSQNYRHHIQSAFGERHRQYQKTDVMQLLLILLFLGGFFGYIYFGNIALYSFIVLFSGYIFFRIKRQR